MLIISRLKCFETIWSYAKPCISFDFSNHWTYILLRLDPPSVTVKASPSSELNENDNMSLSCTYESNPYSSILTWTRNGRIISHYPEYNQFNIPRDYNGLYVCNVSNEIGYGIDSVQISVFCK